VNLELIRFLKKQSAYTPVPELQKAAGLGRADVFTEVEVLLEEGYSIEFHPYLGVKLIDIPDRLLAHEIQEDLNTRSVGRRLEVFEQVPSTNDKAWELLEQEPDLPDGTVVLADEQTQARGRLGRAWHSAPRAGLWLSVVLRMGLPPDKQPFLTAAAALATANMLEQFGQFPAEIKWPNDVIIRGRKCSGILVEARSDKPEVYVLGLGLNVNQLREDFPEELRDVATSLRLERPGARPINRVRVLRPLLFYLERVLEQVRRRKWERVSKAWAEFVSMGGRRVRLTHAGAEVVGTVVRVDPAAGITLKLDEDEEPHTYSAEGVSSVREAKVPEEDGG
jgi:BirA family transcriptional regulator, biotin operon repressor / biotin---[acetyl-CoA-carboxylase] ligase